jgi:hypothetical protein
MEYIDAFTLAEQINLYFTSTNILKYNYNNTTLVTTTTHAVNAEVTASCIFQAYIIFAKKNKVYILDPVNNAVLAGITTLYP